MKSISNLAQITNIIPGLTLFQNFKFKWLFNDFTAGLSVAAISIPVGLAYADLAGLPPVYGLYTSMLPVIIYTFFSTSRLLVVGPDSAICMLMAVSLAPLAAPGTGNYISLSILLTLMVGIFCVMAGIFRLGFLANFLSRPIVTGFLNGIAITIIMGQLGKIFGFKLGYTGFIRTWIVFFGSMNSTHIITLIIGISSIFLLRILKKISMNIPGPLVASIAGILAAYFWGFENQGVKVLGLIQGGLPSIGVPAANLEEISLLVSSAVSITLISYCSNMLTSKSYALQKGFEVDNNKEFIALGIANISSALTSGFIVTGTSSKTAVEESAGAKSPLTSVFSALAIVCVLLFLSSILAYLPEACLGAIIISASISLFNFGYLKRLFKISKREFALSMFTLLCVISIGVVPAVFISIGISIIGILAKGLRPKDAILGKIENYDTYQDINEFKDAKVIPGFLIYRFEASLVFVNADYFKSRVRKFISESENKIDYFILDASSISFTDSTSIDTLDDLRIELEKKNIKMIIVKAKLPFKNIMEKAGLADKIGKNNFYFSAGNAVDNILNNNNVKKQSVLKNHEMDIV